MARNTTVHKRIDALVSAAITAPATAAFDRLFAVIEERWPELYAQGYDDECVWLELQRTSQADPDVAPLWRAAVRLGWLEEWQRTGCVAADVNPFAPLEGHK